MANIKIFAKDLEEAAQEQLKQLCWTPTFAKQKIRIMADAHAGKGSVIGFTSTIGDTIIPNVVGVDIGCGVYSFEINGVKDIDFDKLDKVIRERIPLGFNVHGEDSNILSNPKAKAAARMVDGLWCSEHLRDKDRLYHSIGTLGGGNHYIEINKSKQGKLYLTVHTGSRNLGKQVCEYYTSLTTPEAGIIKEQYALTSKALVYRYLEDMNFCCRWAEINRYIILEEVLRGMGWEAGEEKYQSVHNYIGTSGDGLMVRKGAISAQKGEKVVIPLNMAEGVVFGVGLGNPDYNYSAPHGAGRKMSRSKAKKCLTLEEYNDKMEGIYSTSIGLHTIDEAPQAYKDSAEIVESLKDTVEVLEIAKSVYNIKA